MAVIVTLNISNLDNREAGVTKCQKKYSSVKNASKHKSQIRISQKPLGLLKNTLIKFLRISSSLHNRFCLKHLRSKLQKLRIAIFGQFWLKLAVGFFLFCDPLENMFFGKVYIQKIPLNILKPLIYFESNSNLK